MMLATQTRSRRLIGPERARAELARRELGKRHLFDFSQYVDPKFERRRHQVFLAGKLEQVLRCIETDGREGIGRLMIFMPPQNGKSALASIKFPAWALGRLPDLRVMLTSYGADLASRNSRAMRDLVNSDRFQAVFGITSSKDEPVMLSGDSRSSTSWDLARPHRGGVLAAGVGGAITGFGADLAVIDDPLKNREEAESEGRRDLVDDWYRSSLLTRLSPHAALIFIMTRWHQDDLAGRLIKRMVTEPDADQWEIMCMPALAIEDYPDVEKQLEMMKEGVYLPLADPLGRKPGEALLPEMYSEEWLEKKRADTSIYEFEALYQQMPYLRAGGFFKRDWLPIVEDGPGKATVKRIRYWDKAATDGGGDYTAGVLMSRDSDGTYFIEDVRRGQWSSGRRDAEMVKTGLDDVKEFGRVVQWHQQDPASAGLDSAKATNDLMAEGGLTARYEPVSGEKDVRAGPLSSKAEAGKVKIVRGAWNEAFLSEATAFPKGRHDDQIDAAASAFNKLRGRGKVVVK